MSILNSKPCPFKEGDIVAKNDFFGSNRQIVQLTDFYIQNWYSWWEGLFDEATLEEKKLWFENEETVLFIFDE